MSSDLRRRIFGVGTPDSTPDISRDPSPAPNRSGQGDSEDYKVIPTKKLEQLTKKVKSTKGRKRRNVWIFALGGLVGVIIAGIFATPTGSLDKLVDLAGLEHMNLDSLIDVLPGGMIRDVKDLQVSKAPP